MKQRNPLAVFFLSLITLGIYDLYWLVKTKKELNAKTRIHTPTIWLLFAPIVVMIVALIVIIVTTGNNTVTNSAFSSNTFSNTTTSTTSTGTALGVLLVELVAILAILPITFYWFFKFSKAVNEYTSGKMSTGVTFILLWALHLIGVAIVQDTFNDMLQGNTFGGGVANPAATNGAAVPQQFVNPPAPQNPVSFGQPPSPVQAYAAPVATPSNPENVGGNPPTPPAGPVAG